MSSTSINSISVYHPSADRVLESITDKTTPEEFLALMSKNPEYDLKYQSESNRHALQEAIFKENEQLFIHIIRKGGADLVNLSSSQGSYGDDLDDNTETPLFVAVCYASLKQRFRIAKTLLQFRADVNAVSITNLGHSVYARTPIMQTATLADNGIKYGIENLIELFLRYKATLPIWEELPDRLNVSQTVISMINRIKNKVDEDTKVTNSFQVYCYMKGKINPTQKLPKNIMTLILHYLRNIKINALE